MGLGKGPLFRRGSRRPCLEMMFAEQGSGFYLDCRSNLGDGWRMEATRGFPSYPSAVVSINDHISGREGKPHPGAEQSSFYPQTGGGGGWEGSQAIPKASIGKGSGISSVR